MARQMASRLTDLGGKSAGCGDKVVSLYSFAQGQTIDGFPSTRCPVGPCYGELISKIRSAATELHKRSAEQKSSELQEQAMRLDLIVAEISRDGVRCFHLPCHWPNCAFHS